MSLYGLLAMYEADLAAVNEAITLINELSAKIVNLMGVTKDTIEVDDLAYKQEMLDEANEHTETAIEYLSSTVAFLNKKISTTKAEIKVFEENQKKEKEASENS